MIWKNYLIHLMEGKLLIVLLKFIFWIVHKISFSLSSLILSFSFDLTFIRWHKMLLPDLSALTWIQHFSTSSIWLFFLCTNPCTFFISSRKKKVLSRMSASLYICTSLLPNFFVGLSTIHKSSSPHIFFQLSPNFVLFSLWIQFPKKYITFCSYF